MNKYEVVLFIPGGAGTEVFDVDADGHKMDRPHPSEDCPLFIVFYRDEEQQDPKTSVHGPSDTHPGWCICGWEVSGFVAPELVEDKLQAHIAASKESDELATPANHLEVFRAPAPLLLAVKLVDDDELEEEEPEVHS